MLAAAHPGPVLALPEVLTLTVQAFGALGAVQGPGGTSPLRDAMGTLEADFRGLRQALAAALLEVRVLFGKGVGVWLSQTLFCCLVWLDTAQCTLQGISSRLRQQLAPGGAEILQIMANGRCWQKRSQAGVSAHPSLCEDCVCTLMPACTKCQA